MFEKKNHVLVYTFWWQDIHLFSRETDVSQDGCKENESNVSLRQDIEKIKNSIQKKYCTLKHGYIEIDEFLRKSCKPILEPLEKISQMVSEAKRNEEEVETFTIPSKK